MIKQKLKIEAALILWDKKVRSTRQFSQMFWRIRIWLKLTDYIKTHVNCMEPKESANVSDICAASAM